MKYPIQVGYIFQVFSKPLTESGCKVVGSLSVYFEGEYEMDPEPILRTRIAIVPPNLRVNCGRGTLKVMEIYYFSPSNGNPHSIGFPRKGFKLENMNEHSIASEPWGIKLSKDLAKRRISEVVIPYMQDVVGLTVMGEVPYYKEW